MFRGPTVKSTVVSDLENLHVILLNGFLDLINFFQGHAQRFFTIDILNAGVCSVTDHLAVECRIGSNNDSVQISVVEEIHIVRSSVAGIHFLHHTVYLFLNNAADCGKFSIYDVIVDVCRMFTSKPSETHNS